MQGETGSGGKILQLFQESPLLRDPVFKATMTRVAPNAERFHVSGELVAAELPKPLLLSDASAVITVPGVTVVPAAPAGSPTPAKAAAGAATTVTTVPAPPPAAAPTPPVAQPGAPSPSGSPATTPERRP